MFRGSQFSPEKELFGGEILIANVGYTVSHCIKGLVVKENVLLGGV